MKMAQKNKPLRKYRSGSITLAVFSTSTGGESYVLQKSYKKGDEWKNSSLNLFKRELLDITEVLEQFKKI